MHKQTIAIFRNIFLPYSETFIYDSIKRYKKFAPVVFTKKRINHNLFPLDNVVVPRDLKYARQFESFLYSIGISAPSVAQEFEKVAPKLVHAHFGQNGILAIPYVQKFKIPLIVSLHGNDVGILLGRQKFKPKNWFYALSIRRLIKRVSLFLAASTDLKEKFIEFGCPADKIRIHRLGIDIKLFQRRPRAKSNKPITVLMVGRLVEKKGFEYGIRAFAEMLKEIDSPKITLIIIGGGPLKHRLKTLVSQLGLNTHVNFLGILSHQQVKETLMNTADILLAPSIVAQNKDRDSGLMVAKEAAACNIPVIGTFHGGIPDIIEDGKTGYLVPERNISMLAKRLAKLSIDQNLRMQLGKTARLKMEKEYNIEHQMAELEHIYFELIKKFVFQKTS